MLYSSIFYILTEKINQLWGSHKKSVLKFNIQQLQNKCECNSFRQPFSLIWRIDQAAQKSSLWPIFNTGAFGASGHRRIIHHIKVINEVKLTTSRGIMGRCAGAKSARMPCNNTMHTKHSQIPCKIKLLHTIVHMSRIPRTQLETNQLRLCLCFSVCVWGGGHPIALFYLQILTMKCCLHQLLCISRRLLWEWQTEKNREHIKKKQSVKYHGSIILHFCSQA